MLQFWRNPEFVRHRRAELRRPRSLTVAVLAVVICLLVGLACWISRENELENTRRLAVQYGGRWSVLLAQIEQRNAADFWRLFYRVLIYIQAGVVTFWSLLSTTQSISGERERKTWDFQRITRLSSAEILVGKLFGEPILAYFIMLCCLPIAFAAGLLGRVRPLETASAYVLIVSSALFVGLVGLWLSSLLESRSRGIGLIGALGLYALFAFSFGFQDSEFPGLGAFSPLSGLFAQFGSVEPAHRVARIFGAPVSWLLMSLLLYSTFGAWLVLMILQNMKRDYDDVQPLSRWQAVGCASFMNFMAYLLFYPRPQQGITGDEFVTTMVARNAVVIFAVGLATLTPQAHLKLWWRRLTEKQVGLFAEDGLPWPWVVISAVVAYALLACGLLVWRSKFILDTKLLQNGAVELFVVSLFITRDILFIQWCKLTRLRSPLIKGFLYLCLYYAASGMVAGVFAIGSNTLSRQIIDILTPAGVLSGTLYGQSRLSGSTLVSVALQLMLIWVLLRAISRRLGTAAMVRSASAA